jgi:hypothetical protein
MLGADFAHALAAKDTTALTSLLAEHVDFRALTPRKFWEAEDPAGVIDVLLGNWFEPQDEITALLDMTEDEVADTRRVGYRFALATPDGPHVAEQQAYYREEDGRIAYLRIMCSGFRPAG